MTTNNKTEIQNSRHAAKTSKKNIDITKRTKTKRKSAVPKATVVLSEPRADKSMPIISFLKLHVLLLSFILGSVVTVLWTLLRSFTNGVNFDIVGQIGLAEQWSHGLHSGVQLGPTNYLLKIPLYWVVNSFTDIPPHNRIILLAVICNLITFWLLFVICDRLRRLFDNNDQVGGAVALVWLASISGGVFWMDYANSRNLEVVGGAYFIYLVIKLLSQWSKRTILLLTIVGSTTFFADPLQFYVCGIGAMMFALLRMFRLHTKHDIRYSISILSATVVAEILAKICSNIASHVFNITFLTAPRIPGIFSLSNLEKLPLRLIENTLKAFDAKFYATPYTINSVRQLINALILFTFGLAVASIFWRMRKKANYGIWVLFFGIFSSYFAFVASGNVLGLTTSRYLVMIPIFVTMIIASSSNKIILSKYKKSVTLSITILIFCSITLLAGGVAHNYQNRFSKDRHIPELLSFMQNHKYKYALANRETGITMTYFSSGNTTIIPMYCDGNKKIGFTDLVYDQAALRQLSQFHGEVPILLQNGSIQFGKLSCTEADIIKQYGLPKYKATVPNYGVALVYEKFDINQYANNRKNKVKAAKLRSNKIVNSFIQSAPDLPPLAGCTLSKVDVFVAHPDDDLLFMNPELLKKLQAGCVRTIFLTAGDDGKGDDYWMGRQRGIEAAYASMLNVDNSWSDAPVSVQGHDITSRQLTGVNTVNLLFLRLPDGNVGGQGFTRTGNVSLEKMAFSDLKAVTVDGSSEYSYIDMTKVVSDILNSDKPSEVYTQVNTGAMSLGDHSDHRAVGNLTLESMKMAHSSVKITMFVGYPTNFLAKNLDDENIAQKKLIFGTYAANDSIICQTQFDCITDTTYGSFLERCYFISGPSLGF